MDDSRSKAVEQGPFDPSASAPAAGSSAGASAALPDAGAAGGGAGLHGEPLASGFAHASSAVPASASASAAQTAQSAEWLAYRDSLVAYARAGAVALPPNDPRNAVPVSLRPGRHSVHHSYIWLGGLSLFGAIAFAMAISAVGSIASLLEEGIPSIAVLPIVTIVGVVVIAVLAAIVLSVQWLSWKNLSYELTPTEFSLFSGVISKKRRHVPYQRIQSVNQQAGVMQRVLGICNVKIDTAGGASNEAVLLRFVRTSEAEALRSELFRRKKVLLAGGTLDEFGTAFVGGSVVPSAWMAACAGGDVRSVKIAFGADPATVDVSVGAVVPVSAQAASEGNLLDGADEMLNDMRGVFGGEHIATGVVSYETGLSNEELFFAGLSGAAGHFGVIIAGIIGLAGSLAQFFESNIETWVESSIDGMLSGASSDASLPSQGADMLGSLFGSFAWQVALWAVVSVLALWAFSVIGTVVQYGGFKVRRRESRIEVEHGLLQRTFHGIDVDRVQTVVVKQSFVRRLIGYCELSVGKIDSAAQDSQDGQTSSRGMVIHPFVKLDRVPEIIEGVLPEFADTPEETLRPAPVALRRAIVRKAVIRSTMFWLVVGLSLGRIAFESGVRSGAFAIDSGMYAMLETGFAACVALFVFVFALNVVDAVLWYRTSAFGYDRSFMSITNGGLSKKTAVFPRKKIQYGFTKTNPFQRMAHVAIVNARTAAGVGGTTEQLWDVPEDEAARWMEWVRPRMG